MTTSVEAILIKLGQEQIKLSKAIEFALPLLKNNLDAAKLSWLMSEANGYPIAEGDTSFENGLPPSIPEYRGVFCSGVKMHEIGNDNYHDVKGWPKPKGTRESRMQVILWSVESIENKLEKKEDFFYVPASYMEMPASPDPGLEPVIAIHRSQLERILESLRNEFIQVCGAIVQ
jgi:hypothetical protein